MMPSSELSLKVLTPEGVIFEKHNLSGVDVPLVDGGTIGIKPDHAPLIAETIPGKVAFRTNAMKESIQLHAGILEIRDNVVTILTAGTAGEGPRNDVEGSQGEYDRLMRTLIQKVYPEREQADQP